MNIQTVETIAAQIHSLTGPRFVGFTYRAKTTGELARHVVIVGASYANLTSKSIAMLQDMLPTLSGLELEGAKKLLTSYAETLRCIATGTDHSSYSKAGVYSPYKLPNGEEVEGVSVHNSDSSLELHCLAHSKVVIEAGVYKTVNSRPETIAKNKIEALLPRSKYRTPTLDAGAMQSVRVSGLAIDCL